MINEPRSLQGPGEAYGWEEAPDLTSISKEELRARWRELAEEERVVRYRWRVLQGRIDLIGAARGSCWARVRGWSVGRRVEPLF